MPTHDLDELNVSARRAQTPHQTAKSPLSPGHAAILHLQRLAGNESVNSLLEEELSPVRAVVGSGGGSPLDLGVRGHMERQDAPALTAQTLVAQRKGKVIARVPQAGGAAAADPRLDPSQLTDSDIMFRLLPPGRGWLTGTGRNQLAQDLHDEFVLVNQASAEPKDIMSFLHWTEETLGPSSLAAIKAILPAVAKQSAGDAGEKMRSAVDHYTQANPELEGTLLKVKGAEAEVIAKSESFLEKLTDQKGTGASRVEKKAEEEVKAVQENIESKKKWCEEILDGALKVLGGEWKEALKDLGKFALKELVVGPAVEAAYENDLNKAKKSLTQAKAVVESLADEKDLHAVTAAAKDLESAKDMLTAQTKELIAAGRRANSAHRTLVEKLSGMGKTGAAAADALESRQEVADQARLGKEVLGKYQPFVEKASGKAHKLAGLYQQYVEFVLSPGGENEVPNEDLRHTLYEIASSNQWLCKHLENWCADEVGRLGQALNYIASGRYMDSYRAMDASLADEVANR